MSIYKMSPIDLMKVGSIVGHSRQAECVEEIDLTNMVLPVTIFVKTLTTAAFQTREQRQRVDISYVITLHNSGTPPMPVVYKSIQAWRTLDSDDAVNFEDLEDLVQTLENRTSYWDSMCVDHGCISINMAQTLWENWLEPDWIYSATFDNATGTVCLDGEIKDNAVYSNIRKNEGQTITPRWMTWAIQYLIDRELIPDSTLEYPENWDADLSDKVFQVCLFGEVVMD